MKYRDKFYKVQYVGEIVMAMIQPISLDKHLVDCVAEYKKARQLQYDFEWNGQDDKASFYKRQSMYFKKLVKDGVLYEPKF